MAANNISYPHPVLGNGDDIALGGISPSVSYEASSEAIRLIVGELTTGHSDIDQLILCGDAFWHIRVQCSRTYMRESFTTDQNHREIRLKGENYEGMVYVEISVVAQTNISDYRPEGLHEDYGEERFHLHIGEVLAVGPTFRFHVDKVYDPLKAPVSSLIRIAEGEHKDGPFALTLDDDLIIVRLSQADWREYAGIRDRVPTIVHSAIVLPALAEAIRKIGEHTDTLWAGRLSDLLHKKQIDIGAPLAAAQEVLASPVTRTFSEINVTLDRGDA